MHRALRGLGEPGNLARPGQALERLVLDAPDAFGDSPSRRPASRSGVGSSPPTPKRSLMTSRSCSGRLASAAWTASSRRPISTSSTGPRSWLGSRSPSPVSPSGPIGRSRLVTVRVISRVSSTSSIGQVGGRGDLGVRRRATEL